MGKTVDFDIDDEGVELAVTVAQLEVDDIRRMVREDAGDRGERSGLVADDGGQLRDGGVGFGAPRQIEPFAAVAAGVLERRAVDGVDFDAGARKTDTDDAITGNRTAALAKAGTPRRG